MAAFDKAKEGKSAGDLMDMVKLVNDTESLRTIVKTQLWELVDITAPKK